MKKTILLFSLFASVFGFHAQAQDPYTVELFDDAVFYSMYEGAVDQPLPPNAIRNNNSSYGIKLTDEVIANFGSSLTLNVQAASLCDNYDRIGNVNLAFVPKGATSYEYNQVTRIELGRFITPFMIPDGDVEVPYTYDISHVVDILHHPILTDNYDFWIELEIYGYQGSATQGGAAAEYPSICPSTRNDVYRGSLQLVSEGTYTEKFIYFQPLCFKYELKDYTLNGTDVLGETVRTLGFHAPAEVTDTKYYFINSNHGSNSGGEEYVRRWHYIYYDNELKLQYKPGGVSCIPFLQYNTQPSCIFYDCSQNPSPLLPDNDAYWYWNNWCPGDKIPTRVVELGVVPEGDHEFKVDVPDATFNGDQGYFPMSVYVMGTTATLSNDEFAVNSFAVYPNPVNDIATINTGNNITAKSFTVLNTLGQSVMNGTGNNINMGQLQNGVYIIKAEFDNGQVLTQKVVKK
ncbi:peptide-N-glycosidase F-related protein [Flavobacterium rhizosphaerae]|uniref:Peptide-N-glycosidase F-related protein n=1 Tax=Flavobacterium rhizosphaerae TaxID=3163298 RepID=A0ABW8YXF3_9FLAO